MANIPIYDGNPIYIDNLVPFGFYNTDISYKEDAVKVAKFCAQRLGYPLVDVELQAGSFFTAFEEAITTYGNELYAYQTRDNYLTIEGSNRTNSTELNSAFISPSFEPIIRLTEQYGTEAGTGGNVTYHTGSFPLTASKQTYDLKEWAVNNGITSEHGIEVKRVFYEDSPAISKIYNPYVGNGVNLMSSFGFSGMSPAVSFLMMPTNFDLAQIQSIEISEQVRRSNYSFELKNNNLTIFPVPTTSSGVFRFEYINRDERIANNIQIGLNSPTGVVNNVSKAQYGNPDYGLINSIGRQWIFEYTLALSKEMLGYVRGKYSNIPIPDSNVTLNQSDLITAATAEKTALIEKLRTFFDETSRKSLLERRSQEAEFKQTELKQVPYTIYIG